MEPWPWDDKYLFFTLNIDLDWYVPQNQCSFWEKMFVWFFSSTCSPVSQDQVGTGWRAGRKDPFTHTGCMWHCCRQLCAAFSHAWTWSYLQVTQTTDTYCWLLSLPFQGLRATAVCSFIQGTASPRCQALCWGLEKYSEHHQPAALFSHGTQALLRRWH